jgi:hypothetical protein
MTVASATAIRRPTLTVVAVAVTAAPTRPLARKLILNSMPVMRLRGRKSAQDRVDARRVGSSGNHAAMEHAVLLHELVASIQLDTSPAGLSPFAEAKAKETVERYSVERLAGRFHGRLRRLDERTEAEGRVRVRCRVAHDHTRNCHGRSRPPIMERRRTDASAGERGPGRGVRRRQSLDRGRAYRFRPHA